MDQDDKVLDKVRKLLAKAESVAGTPEADTFQAKAFEILAKYGIDENAVRAETGSGDGGDMVMRTIEFAAPYAESRRNLYSRVAQAMHCKAVLGHGGELFVVGARTHQERVAMVFDLLVVQMMAGASRTSPSDPTNPWAESGIRKHRGDWMLGFASAAAQRLKDAEARAVGDYDRGKGSDGAAVMLQSDVDAAEAAMRKRFPFMGSSRPRAVGSGFGSGQAAGRSADIGSSRIGNVRQAIGR